MNMPIDVIHIGDYSNRPVKCVRDLGVVFDHHMTIHENITKTCASCYFHRRNISYIRDSLTDEATISSFSDLCHPELIIATRFCMEYQNMPSKGCNVCKTWLPVSSRVRQSSSKLPVKYRIIFKVVLLTFKAMHGMAPNYLKTLLQSYMPSRSLRCETWKFTHHAERTPQIRMPYFRLCGPQIVERNSCEHYNHHLLCIVQIILKNSSF